MSLTQKKRKRIYRSVRHEGGSVVLTIGRDMIPDGWKIVSLTLESSDYNAERPFIILKIEKVNNAQIG